MPEHVPPERHKWHTLEMIYEEKMAAAAAEEWRRLHTEGKVYDHNSYNDTWDGGGSSAAQVLEG